jgi:predicted ATPase
MDYIEIRGFRSIRDQRIDLRNLNVMIGANGSGKTNLIMFFEFLSRLYNRDLSGYIKECGGVDQILHHGIYPSSELSFELGFESGRRTYAATLRRSGDGLVFVRERITYLENIWSMLHNGSESEIHNAGASMLEPLQELKNCRRYHFHDITSRILSSPPCHVDEKEYLYAGGENLASILYDVQQNDPLLYKRTLRLIQGIAPYLSDFVFRPDGAGRLRFEWKDRYSGDTIRDIRSMSEGTLRFIALSTLLTCRKQPLMTIDEPEIGINPEEMEYMAVSVQVAAKRHQVIIAIQSSALLNEFNIEDLITVDLVQGGSHFKHITEESLGALRDDMDCSIYYLWHHLQAIKTGHTHQIPA